VVAAAAPAPQWVCAACAAQSVPGYLTPADLCRTNVTERGYLGKPDKGRTLWLGRESMRSNARTHKGSD
jgi:hypothetical protein